MPRRRAMLILAGSLAGCAPRPPAPVPVSAGQSASAATDSAATDSAVLTLERTPCFGACPVYRVTVSADGTVHFQGKSFVSHPGSALAQIPKARMDSLIAELDAGGYFRFDERYVPGSPACGNAATDLPTVTTSVTLGGRTKRIEHYRGCSAAPLSLSRLEDRIDEVLNTGRWVGQGR
jgi:hypothetical protein